MLRSNADADSQDTNAATLIDASSNVALLEAFPSKRKPRKMKPTFQAPLLIACTATTIPE